MTVRGTNYYVTNKSSRLLLFLACACLPVSLSLAAQDKDSTQKQLEKLEAEIEKRQASQKDLEEKAASAKKQISSLQLEMVDIGRKLQVTEGSIFRLDDRIETLTRMTREKQKDLFSKRENMMELMAALQRLGRRPATAALLKPGEALDTARSATLLATILPEINAKATLLRRDLTDLNDMYRELSSNRFQLKNKLGQLAQEKTILANLVRQREIEENQARAAARGESLRIARLVRSSKTTKELLEKLEKESERLRQQKLRLEKLELARKQQDTAQQGAKNQSEFTRETPLNSTRFTALKGKMPYPTFGKIIKKYGQVDGASTTKGIRLSVRPGSQVISPFEGKVVYAGPFRDYGQLVIIAHNDGYHGLLAGMGSLYTALNQWVLQGEPLGTIGGTSGGTSSGAEKADGAVAEASQLYFELRGSKGPFNPVPWLQKTP